MSIRERLNEVFDSAEGIEFNNSARFILFSDCHRGDNSWADDFAHNQQLFFHALKSYYDAGFTYIEVGDGDELWENRSFSAIRQAHSHVFWLMRKFYQENRLLLLYGNHDIERQNPQLVENTLYTYFDARTKTFEPLFNGIRVHEGLIMRHAETGRKLYLVHGHQADPTGDRWWRFSRFMVRHVWRHLQLLGFNDPTSPAKNFEKRNKVEEELIDWVRATGNVLIAGHTHRSVFPDEGEPRYFNTGSCVHPRCITGLEIQNGELALIKWSLEPNDEGLLRVAKEILVGPKSLEDIFTPS